MRKLTASAIAGAVALFAVFTPHASYALGGDPNLLVKARPAPKGYGYVLFSISYLKPYFMKYERPCLQVHMKPVVQAQATDSKPRMQYLGTTTGMHCNTAWKTPQSIREDDAEARVVVLTAVPAGEYEILTGNIQYSVATLVYHGDSGVTGFGRIQVEPGRIAYAGTFRLLMASNRALFTASDALAEDEPVLRQLRPDLASLGIEKATWAGTSGN